MFVAMRAVHAGTASRPGAQTQHLRSGTVQGARQGKAKQSVSPEWCNRPRTNCLCGLIAVYEGVSQRCLKGVR